MYIYIKIFLLSALPFFILHAEQPNSHNLKYISVPIIESGKKNYLRVSIPETNDTTQNNKIKNGVMIRFKKNVTVDIPQIEAKYNLKFIKKLHIGYYIFNNLSDYDDITLIQKMIQEEKTIDTIKPNWKKHHKAI